MTELENYISNYFEVAHTDLSKVGNLFTEKRIAKGDFFLKIHKYSDQIGFLKSGYLRIYAPDSHENKEITQWISATGSFVADLSSFMFQSPARWNIQALTDCEVYMISKKDFDSIAAIVPQWPQLEKLFVAKCFITLENRVFGHLSMTAEERYHSFFSKHPEMFNEVPLQYLASMLGMSPETFSRIRKKLSS